MSGRVLAISLATVAMVLGLPAVASAVTVKVIDEQVDRTYVLDLGENADEHDVVDTPYAIRSGSGTTPQTVDGFSLDQVNKLAVDQANGQVGADRYSYTYLEVERPGGAPVQLTNRQVRYSQSPDGPPVVYEDGGSVGFIRPSIAAGDKNAVDSFSVPNELVIRLKYRSPIEISLNASDTQVEVGDEVDFTAVVTHPDNLEPVVEWDFGDGSDVSGVEFVPHRWKTAGTYHVVVTAKNPENDQGPGASVEIEVGEGKKGRPDRKGGGEDEEEGAPDTGSSEGTGGSEGGTTTGPGATPSVSPAVPPVVTPDPPEPRDPDRDDPERDPATGEEVSGELLQDAVVVAPEPETKPEEKTKAPTARTGTEAGDGFGIPGAALGGMSVLALLGIGGLAQAGKIRPDSMVWHMNRLVGR